MRQPMHVKDRVCWTAERMRDDRGWMFPLEERARRDLLAAAQGLKDLDRPLFDWRRDEFDLGAALPTLRAAFAEVRDGSGVALVQGLPREALTADQFRALVWGIGLHFGVARPQGKTSQYLSAVRDEGTDYRSATGRGYSSNAGLDFHVDGCDVVALACWNVARAGGQSMFTSSISAHNALLAERPDLVDLLYEPFCYSRQGEQAPDEPPFLRCPIYGVADGRLIGRWNRNRVKSAQALEGVPPLTPVQWEALDLLDGLLRSPALMAEMWLAARRPAADEQPLLPALAHALRGLRRAGEEAPALAALAGDAGQPAPAAALGRALQERGARRGARRHPRLALGRCLPRLGTPAGGGAGDDRAAELRAPG